VAALKASKASLAAVVAMKADEVPRQQWMLMMM
jgi:hypothetical protein